MILRAILALPVVAGLAWSVVAAPLAIRGTGVSRMVDRIASGDRYDGPVLETAARSAERSTGYLCAERFLRDAVVIRSRLAEQALSEGQIDRIDGRFADVRRAALALLSCSPGQALGWLALYWTDLQNGRSATPEAQEMLRRSYRFGPHEFWVQVRRNPLALATYGTLSEDLKVEALDEFVEILKAGGYAQAASILIGPGNQLATALRERIASLPEHTRRMLARQFRVMREDVDVPGIEPRDPRWR